LLPITTTTTVVESVELLDSYRPHSNDRTVKTKVVAMGEYGT
jgi:hypothetical protein